MTQEFTPAKGPYDFDRTWKGINKPVVPYDYIRAWGKEHKWRPAQIEGELDRARAHNAPEDATYFDHMELVWKTSGDATDDMRSRLIDLVEEERRGRAG